ncbi:MAG: DUF1206 domain-containing protein [Marinobacter sp.]
MAICTQKGFIASTPGQVVLALVGLTAKGVAWLIVGWFLIQSALDARAGDIAGMGEALNALASSPYGAWLLGIVA